MSLKLTFATSLAALTMLAASGALAATVTTPLNVRDGPDGDVIGLLEEGTEVECADMVGNWCELADGEGYVYGRYLDFGDDGDDDEDEDDDEPDEDDIDLGDDDDDNGY